MTKRNKITFLIAEALLAVLAAYFFYSIFHGDVPPKKVAVIVENSGDKRWDSLLNGMKQAAKVQNLSLIICNTDEQESSEDEQEMIREQLENDVDAFIINPAPGQDTKQVLEQLQGTKPSCQDTSLRSEMYSKIPLPARQKDLSPEILSIRTELNVP